MKFTPHNFLNSISRVACASFFALLSSLVLVPNPALAALSIDGTSVAGTVSSASSISTESYQGDYLDPNGVLTTSNANDVIVVSILNENTSASYVPVSSVTATGLTFTLRDRYQYAAPAGDYADFEIWYAVATSTFSGDITANFSSAAYDDASMLAFAISGANISSPWDSNGSLPAIATIGGSRAIPSVADVSTTAANTMLFMFNGSINAFAPEPFSPDEPGTDNVFLNPASTGGYWGNDGGTYASFQTNIYQVASSTLSNTTISLGADNNYLNTISIVDAIQAASSQVLTGRIIRLVGGVRLRGGVRLE